jgi:hypothetical protein
MIEDSNDIHAQSAFALRSKTDGDRVGYRNPPRSSRFKPGRSGNPAGRRAKSPTGSAFTLILDKTVMVKSKSKVETRSVEEALQLRTYQEALKGKSMAIREVLRWILKRETWLARNRPVSQRRFTYAGIRQDPDNADEAMVILGIATHDPKGADRRQDRAQLLLEPWVVKLALGRSRRVRALTNKDLEDIRRCSRDDGSINLPRGEPG